MSVQPKQIAKNLSSWVRVSNFSVSGDDADVTTPVTTALSTAGEGGVSVPLQPLGGSNLIGVHETTGQLNRCNVYDHDTLMPIADVEGNEVYGRMTEAGGVYTLSFYVLDGGTETVYSFASANDIDFEFAYRFDFARLPANALIAINGRNVGDDPAATGGTQFQESITITSNGQTAFTLSKSPTASFVVTVYLNGVAYQPVGGAPPISVGGAGNKTVTWSNANAGFATETTDTFIASYPTFE